MPATETLFVWGDEAELYPLSGRLPTTRFLNSAGLAANADASVNARRDEMMASLRHVRYFPELQQLLTQSYRQMDDAVLQPYLGGDREQVFVRTGPDDLCTAMPGCRLS